MKKLFTVVITLLLIISIITPAFAANGNAGSFDYDAIITETVNAKMQAMEVASIQELVDKMAESPASGNEWFIMGIRNEYENLDYSLYRTALEKYVSETNISNAASRLRIALTLTALNSSSDFIQKTAEDAIGVQGLMTYVFGLHLLNNGVTSSQYTVDSLIEYIISVQGQDGGWSLNGGTSDPDITSMVIEALAVKKDDAIVNEAIQNGLAVLSKFQLDNGGYSSYGAINPESACQVMMACAAVGIDAIGNNQFIKNNNGIIDFIQSFKLIDGQYCHLVDGAANTTTQTQVFYSMIAYKMFKEDGANYYVFPALSETVIERKEETTTKTINIKTLLYIAIAVLFVIICIINLVKGKKNIKVYLSTALICAIATVGVSFINIQSTGDFYQKESSEKSIFTTISIYCDTVKGQADYIPDDGIIMQYNTITVKENATVYDQLVAACKEYKIQMESNGSSYVNGINYIYEFKFGDLSGWMFKVNGEFASVGCGEYKLKDGDYVEWVYTTNLGKDVGQEDINTLGE